MKTKHTARVGETYFQHMMFAMKVSMRLLCSGCAFFIHAILPWITIPSKLNLEKMALSLMNSSVDRAFKRNGD